MPIFLGKGDSAILLWNNKKINVIAFAFTLIELLAVIVIIAVLLSLLLSAIIMVKKDSLTVGCLNNERAVSISIFMFSSDNDGRIKPSFKDSAVFNIDFVYSRYVQDAKTFQCPASKNSSRFVSFNNLVVPGDFAVFSPFCYADALNLSKTKNPGSFRMIGEAIPFPTGYYWFDKDICRWDKSAQWRHRIKMNVIFMDGSGLLEKQINPKIPVPPYQK